MRAGHLVGQAGRIEDKIDDKDWKDFFDYVG